MATGTLPEGMDEGVAVDSGLPQNAGEGADGSGCRSAKHQVAALLTHSSNPKRFRGAKAGCGHSSTHGAHFRALGHVDVLIAVKNRRESLGDDCSRRR